MINTTITIRIHLDTWKRLKKTIPYNKGETLNDYFLRVANTLEELNAEVNFKYSD